MEPSSKTFAVPLHLSLTEPRKIAGASFRWVVLAAMICALITVTLKLPLIGLPLFPLLHALGVWMTKRDPYFLDILPRHLAHGRYNDFLEG